MAGGGDSWTRFVTALKVLLPLGALGLLSTLFFFSGEVDPTQSIPYAELNVEELAENQRVTAPYFAGVTDEGIAITLTGEAVIPDLENRQRFRMERISARLEDGDARTLAAQAGAGDVAGDLGTATLRDGALLTLSNGITVQTEGVRIELETANMETLGSIEAEGPFGSVRADRMTVVRPSAEAPHRIVFQGGVKMVYVEPG